MYARELSLKVSEAARVVYKELGVGFLEVAYQNALIIVLEDMGLKVESEKELDLWFRGRLIGKYFVDLLVEDTIILELKAVKEIVPRFRAQTVNYLKCSDYHVAYLINFGKTLLETERFINFGER